MSGALNLDVTPSFARGERQEGPVRRPFPTAAAGRAALYVVLPLLLVALWQAAFELGLIRPILLPPPSRVAQAFLALLGSCLLYTSRRG